MCQINTVITEKIIPLVFYYPAMLHEKPKPSFKSCRHLIASGFPPATETVHFHKSAVTWKSTEAIMELIFNIFSSIKHLSYTSYFDYIFWEEVFFRMFVSLGFLLLFLK